MPSTLERLTVTMPVEMAATIKQAVDEGEYASTSEVVREAIRLLKRVEEQRALRTERLRAAVRDGDAALARGEFADLKSDLDLDAFIAEL